MSLRKVGLLGGSFDPPHLAHLALGRCAMQSLGLDELRWLPARAPWQKVGRDMASAQHRLAMLQLLLADEPASVIDSCELERDGLTYTVDTVRALRAAMPDTDWFLVIGQDQYARFDTWQGWPELLASLSLAVAGRDGLVPTPPAALRLHAHRVVPLGLPRLDISASLVRERCAKGQAIAPLVGERVAGYIDQHRLYADPDPDPYRHRN